VPDLAQGVGGGAPERLFQVAFHGQAVVGVELPDVLAHEGLDLHGQPLLPAGVHRLKVHRPGLAGEGVDVDGQGLHLADVTRYQDQCAAQAQAGEAEHGNGVLEEKVDESQMPGSADEIVAAAHVSPPGRRRPPAWMSR